MKKVRLQFVLLICPVGSQIYSTCSLPVAAQSNRVTSGGRAVAFPGLFVGGPVHVESRLASALHPGTRADPRGHVRGLNEKRGAEKAVAKRHAKRHPRSQAGEACNTHAPGSTTSVVMHGHHAHHLPPAAASSVKPSIWGRRSRDTGRGKICASKAAMRSSLLLTAASS